jgi:UDP-galactopyranose mutase
MPPDEPFDLLIAGAGPVGCVIAERAASQLGWTSLIVEKRDHIAGNCYDREHESGVRIHQYGPHYFRTNNEMLLGYLSRFTEWLPGNYIVKSRVKGRLFPFPINLDTLEQFFGRPFTSEEAESFLEGIREKIEEPKNSEDYVLSRVGRELYESFYLGYTLKQWERHPRDLAPSVCGRIPVRFDRDPRYVAHKYQLTPKDGFTAMFERMIDHPNVSVRLRTDFFDLRKQVRPRRGTVYCGPIDVYFDYAYGKLPWRSLHFDFRTRDTEFEQPCVQINYPDEHDYTRSVEIKHVTRQQHEKTVVSYEYPRSEGDPYYPVPAEQHQRIYERYKALGERERRDRHVYFAGRLAQYTYINTDQAIEIALSTFEEIRRDLG